MAAKLVGAYTAGDGPNTDLEFLATRREQSPVPGECKCRDDSRVPFEFPRGPPREKVPEGYVAVMPSAEKAMTILGKDAPQQTGVRIVRMRDLEIPSIGIMCEIPKDGRQMVAFIYTVGEQHRIVGTP